MKYDMGSGLRDACTIPSESLASMIREDLAVRGAEVSKVVVREIQYTPR